MAGKPCADSCAESRGNALPAEALRFLGEALEARRMGTVLFTVQEGRVRTWTFLPW